MADNSITPIIVEGEDYQALQTTLTALRQRVAELENAERDRQNAESALRHREDLFRATFEQAAVGISFATLSGRFTHSNQRWCEIIGYSEDDLLELHVEDITHPEDVDNDAAFLDYLLADQVSQYSIEKRYIRKDRTLVWVNLNVSLMRLPSGEPRYIIGVIQDITERKRAEAERQRAEMQLKQKAEDLEAALRELQQAQTQLVQSEKMSSLGQLVAGVAHEINNPVNFIHGNLRHATAYIQDLLGLLRQYQQCYPTPNPSIQAEIEAIDLDFLIQDLPDLLGSMRVGADRIREIIASLRNFSRLDEAEFKVVDLHDGIDSTLMILQNRLKSRPDSFRIELVKSYGDLPNVECFPGQLNQVFMNILTNAIDALEELFALDQASLVEEGDRSNNLAAVTPRSPTIHIHTEMLDSNRVTIRIIDNGPGIPEAIQPRLFDPFFTTKPVGKGTGLGMSISYQIVAEKHNGELRCISVPGQGTEFIVDIPIRQLGMGS